MILFFREKSQRMPKKRSGAILMVRGIYQGGDTVKPDVSSTEHDQNLMLVYAVEMKLYRLPRMFCHGMHKFCAL